jgi:hypothetical protein
MVEGETEDLMNKEVPSNFSVFFLKSLYTSLCGAMTATFSIFQPYRGDPTPFEKEAVMTYTGNFQTCHSTCFNDTVLIFLTKQTFLLLIGLHHNGIQLQ